MFLFLLVLVSCLFWFVLFFNFVSSIFKVVAFILALGVGIGVGFAIGNNEVGEKEPIIGK